MSGWVFGGNSERNPVKLQQLFHFNSSFKTTVTPIRTQHSDEAADLRFQLKRVKKKRPVILFCCCFFFHDRVFAAISRPGRPHTWSHPSAAVPILQDNTWMLPCFLNKQDRGSVRTERATHSQAQITSSLGCRTQRKKLKPGQRLSPFSFQLLPQDC